MIKFKLFTIGIVLLLLASNANAIEVLIVNKEYIFFGTKIQATNKFKLCDTSTMTIPKNSIIEKTKYTCNDSSRIVPKGITIHAIKWGNTINNLIVILSNGKKLEFNISNDNSQILKIDKMKFKRSENIEYKK